jgi:hypothetical protein
LDHLIVNSIESIETMCVHCRTKVTSAQQANPASRVLWADNPQVSDGEDEVSDVDAAGTSAMSDRFVLIEISDLLVLRLSFVQYFESFDGYQQLPPFMSAVMYFRRQPPTPRNKDRSVAASAKTLKRQRSVTPPKPARGRPAKPRK